MYSKEKAVLLGAKNFQKYTNESIVYFEKIMSEVKNTYFFTSDIKENFLLKVQEKVEIILRELSQLRFRDEEIEVIKKACAFLMTASEYLKVFGETDEIKLAKKLDGVADTLQTCIANSAFKLAMA